MIKSNRDNGVVCGIENLNLASDQGAYTWYDHDPMPIGLEALEPRILLSGTPIPDPIQDNPQGGLVYSQSIAESFTGALETDQYSIELEAGQQLAVGIVPDPDNPTVLAELTITRPDSLSSITVTAGADGQIVALTPSEGVVTTAGTYMISVSNPTGTLGDYTIEVLINAEVEEELLNGTPNDTLADAEDISDSGINLNGLDALRYAVVGDLMGDEDWYEFSALLGDYFTFVLSGNSGDGNDQLRTDYSLAPADVPVDIATGDLDGDGDLDLVIASRSDINNNYYYVNNQPQSTITVLMGQGGTGTNPGPGGPGGAYGEFIPGEDNAILGNGQFQFFGQYQIPEMVTGVALGDLDGDGQVDIATSHFSTNDGYSYYGRAYGYYGGGYRTSLRGGLVNVIWGDWANGLGDGTDGQSSYDVAFGARDIKIGDFDPDAGVSLSEGVVTDGGILADGFIDPDADLDIIVSHSGRNFYYNYYYYSYGPYYYSYDAYGAPIGEPFYNTGYNYQQTAYRVSGITVLLGTGNERSSGSILDFGTFFFDPNGIGGSSLDYGDFDGDGDMDVAVANSGYYYSPYSNYNGFYGYSGRQISIWTNNGYGTFTTNNGYYSYGYLDSQYVAGAPSALVVSNFDSDNLADIAFIDRFDGSVNILLNQNFGGGNGYSASQPFVVSIAMPDGQTAIDISHGDVDGDGDEDIIVALAENAYNPVTGDYDGQVAILLNDGYGYFSEPEIQFTATGALAVAAGDFDGDGDDDVAAATDADDSEYYYNPEETLEDVVYVPNYYYHPYGAAIASVLIGTSTIAPIELYDSSGTLLAVANLDALNVDQFIEGFVPETAGDYYIRVQGGGEYDLVVTRNANFDLEANDPAGNAKSISLVHRVLGSVGIEQPALSTEVEPNDDGQSDSISLADRNLANDLNNSFTDLGGGVYQAIISGTIESAFAHDYFAVNFAPGDSVSIALNGDNLIGELGDPYLVLYSPDGDFLSANNTGPSFPDALINFSNFTQTGTHYIQAQGLGATSGTYELIVTLTSSNPQIGPDSDQYTFNATAGNPLTISLTTPGSGIGQPENDLEARLELWHETNGLVASAPSPASALLYANTEGGNYRVVVIGASGGGEYFLQVDGADASDSGPVVVEQNLPDGFLTNNIGNYFQVRFDQPLRLDTIDSTDLTVLDPSNSPIAAAVLGVTIVDNYTLGFLLDDSLFTTDGTYTFQIAAGNLKDLQGTDSQAFSSTVILDTVAPEVIFTIPTDQADLVAPFNTIQVTFSEAVQNYDFLDTLIVRPSNTGFYTFTPTILNGDASQYTVNFSSQAEEGTYTITIGPDVQDLAGNSMAGTYTIQIDLTSPDLQVTMIDLGSLTGATWGQPIEFDYTVTNTGSAAALSNWTDYFYITPQNNSISGATFIGSRSISGGLASGDSYTITNQLVNLPLNTNVNENQWFLAVVTDIFGQQIEDENSNNTAFSAPIDMTVPPFPDLVVSDIQIPEDAISGQTVIVSWTITNQGDADATGTWSDYLYYSSDDVAGPFYFNETFLGSYQFTGTLAAGQSIERQAEVTIPIAFNGDYWIVAHTDGPLPSGSSEYQGNIYEHTAWNNNSAISADPMHVQLAPYPNLVASIISAPASADSGGETVITWQVTNNGTGATSTPNWTDFLYLNDTPDLNTATPLGSAGNVSFLNVGDSYQNSMTVSIPQSWVNANSYFIVLTDAYNGVFENGLEADNVDASNPSNISIPPQPNLHVSSIVQLDPAFRGQTMDVRWTVENDGDAPTQVTNWHDRIYLSSDAILDGSDTLLKSVVFTGGPLSNASGSNTYTQTTSVNLPVDVSGAQFLLVQTDAFDGVWEILEGANNVSSLAINIANVPPADLEVTSVNAPLTGSIGRSLAVSWTVENFGPEPTSTSYWLDRVYLSTDNVLDTATDTVLGTVDHFGTLASGGSYTANFNFTVPNNPALAGPMFVFVRSDIDDYVYEGGTTPVEQTNNTGLDATPTTLSFNPPNLNVAINSISDASPNNGDTIQVDFTVTNNGTGDTIRSDWYDRVVLSTSPTPGAGIETQLALIYHSSLLNPGDSYSQIVDVTIPFSSVGNLYILVNTDTYGQVVENGSLAHENDNHAALPVTVTSILPDIRVVSMATTETINSGLITKNGLDSLQLDWTVQNLGASATNATFWYDQIYLSADAFFDGGDTLIGRERHSGILGPGASYNASTSFTLPNTLSGEFYVLVRSDIDNQVFEGTLGAPGEINNDGASNAAIVPFKVNLTPVVLPQFDLRVTSVQAPATATSGQPFSLTWTVENVGNGATPSGWYDLVYLSRDQILDIGTDLYLGYSYHSPGLPATDGANGMGLDSYTQTTSFTIPNGQAGPFYAFVLTSHGITGDASSLNNSGFDSGLLNVSLPAPVDLVAGTVNVPASGSPGVTASISYSIENNSSQTLSGSWRDNLYLSLDDTWDVGDALITTVFKNGTVASMDSYTENVNVALPGVAPGDYHVIVRTDILNQLPELSEANNISASLTTFNVDAQELALNGPATTGSLDDNQSAFFKVEVGAGETLLINFDSDSATAFNELFVSYGQMPGRGDFDFRFEEPFQADQQIVVPITRAGTYFILAYGDSVPGAAANFSITAQTLDFSVLGITTDRGSNRGQVSMVVNGAKYTPTTQVKLVMGATERIAQTTLYKDSSELWATFDLTGLALGDYDIVAFDGLQADTLAGAFEVTDGPVGQVEISLTGPSAVRPGQGGIVRLTYANTGQTDVIAPLINLTSTGAHFIDPLSGHGVSEFNFLGVSADGQAGILAPGQSNSIQVAFSAFGETTFDADFVAAYQPEAQNPIDWTALKSQFQLPGISNDAWDVIWNNFAAELGSNAADMLEMLGENATHLSLVADRTFSLPNLFGFEIEQAAGGMSPQAFLASSVDAVDEAPGIDLAFTRFFRNDIGQWHEAGPFGQGWVHSWQMRLTTGGLGEVFISEPYGSVHTFNLINGSYESLFGGGGTLTDTGGGTFDLARENGQVWHFNASGQLEYIEDHNANRVTATYDMAGRLTQLDHSNTSASLVFTYNAADLISSVTDSTGRTTTYAYDVTNTYLISATDFTGRVTAYTYDSLNGSPSEHALTSTTIASGTPDASSEFFTYDAQGRLSTMSRTGGASLTTFTYDEAGLTTVADALGNSRDIYFDEYGRQVRYIDAENRVTTLDFDLLGNLASIVDSLGLLTSYTYDAQGNLTSIVDPSGATTTFTYGGGPLDQIATAIDPLGNTTTFAYDAAGNAQSRMLADTTIELFSYDTNGLIDTLTTRGGGLIDYTHDALGRLQTKTYSTGEVYNYTYDASGNLNTITGPDGTTDFDYDANDRLVRTTYASGEYVQFTYDAAGRRQTVRLFNAADVQQSELTAFYDAAGRVTRFNDGTTDVLMFTYDAAGNVTRRDYGNGAATTYTYDASGLIHRIEILDASAAVIGFHEYQYDAAGRVTSIDSEKGLWEYTYDAASRLTIAQFTSVNPSLNPDQLLEYQYDSFGNRLSTMVNGASTTYTANDVNQYTTVGADTYTYDDNGNLISRTTGGVTTTYTYDLENRLRTVDVNSDATIEFTYTYNGLGQLTSIDNLGSVTNLVIDPAGVGSVIGEFDSAGNLQRYFDYTGQLSRIVDGAGNESYLVGEFNGSTSQILDVTGSSVLADYHYDPFGNLLNTPASGDQGYSYLGQFGVYETGDGLYQMRNRFYDPTLGQFITEDPLRQTAVNSREYGLSDPINNIDPNGLWSWGQFGRDVLGVVGGGLEIAAGIALAPVSGGASLVFAVHGAYGVGAGIGNTVNNAMDVKPVLSGNLGADLGKGIDTVAGTNGVFEGIGGVGDLGLGLWNPASGASKIPLALQKYEKVVDILGKTQSLLNSGVTIYDSIDKINQALKDEGSNLRAVPVQDGDQIVIRFVQSSDPNDIVGPEGFGDEKWVTATETLPYTIRFENEQSATAPAKVVTIDHQLDGDLDFRTFRLESWGFSGMVFDIPDDRSFFSQDLEPMEINGIEVIVRFTASIDATTGLAQWEISTLDPETLEVHQDADAGFLPPNDENGVGDGFVSFSVKADRNAATGEVIDAEATIIFDNNAPIDTPPIFNTIDNGLPESMVNALPANSPTLDFDVSWAGMDDLDGSALAGFDIFVSIDGGEFELWLEGTTQTSATYNGAEGKTYAFYSVAVDNAGNREAAPESADATTTTPVFNTAPTIPDDGGDQTIDEGDTFTRAIAFTDPDAGDPWTAMVDFGEGAGFVAATINGMDIDLSNVYEQDGIYTVMVLVNDGLEDSLTESFQITVDNVAPTLTAQVAGDIFENDFVTLSGTIADPGLLDSFTLDIDWGDGSAVQTVNFSAGTAIFDLMHQYLDDSPSGTAFDVYQINLTLADSFGGMDTAQTSVRVDDQAPVITSLSLSDISENGVATLTGTYTDAGTLDTHTLDIDWGDGTTQLGVVVSGGLFNVQHQYLDDSPSGTDADSFTVTGTLRDDDGLSDTDSTSLTVNNVAPTITNLQLDAMTIDESGTVMIDGTFNDPGTLDSFTVVINWGDGSADTILNLAAGQTTFNASHEYGDDHPASGTPADTFTISVTVSDDDSGSDTASVDVTVNNVAPTLSVVGNQSVDEDTLLSIVNIGTFIDPGFGINEIFEYSIDWGDGSAVDTGSATIDTAGTSTTNTAGSFDGSHTYADAGNYTVIVTVTDDDGGVHSGQFQVQVLATVPPMVSAVQIDDGAAQRSMVRSLTVVFDQQVDLGTDAIRVIQPSGDEVVTSITNPSADRRTFQITFPNGDPATGSLADGNYQLQIIASLVTNDSSLPMTANFTQDFFRLAGDSDGDRDIDRLDLRTMLVSLNTTQGQPKFSSAFDFNGDDDVDSLDLMNLVSRLNSSLATELFPEVQPEVAPLSLMGVNGVGGGGSSLFDSDFSVFGGGSNADLLDVDDADETDTVNVLKV